MRSHEGTGQHALLWACSSPLRRRSGAGVVCVVYHAYESRLTSAASKQQRRSSPERQFEHVAHLRTLTLELALYAGVACCGVDCNSNDGSCG